jgi:hypothetical protein
MSGYGVEGFPNCEAKSDAWYSMEATQNHYLDFMSDNAVFDSGPMQRRVMTSLLSAYERLLAAAPTKSAASWPGRATNDAELLTLIAEAKKATVPVSDQEALLRNLERFEQGRTATDEALRREYRLCQAIWASGADKVKARVPDPDDWFVTFPPLSDVKDAPK